MIGRIFTNSVKILAMKYFFLTLLLLLVVVFYNTNHNNPKDDTLTPTEDTQLKTADPTGDIFPNQATKAGETDTPDNTPLYEVVRVIDGDTIEVLIDGEKKTVRYIGMNTPETVHPSKPVECFGIEASNKNKELVSGKKVRLVKDVSETDKYGRLLRYVYVDDTFINLILVQEGYANVSSYPPDVTFSEKFRKAEQEARESKLGLWGDTCTNTSTQNLKKSSPATALISVTEDNQPTGQCTIKGNINLEDEKIYHTIGCASYNKTKINEDAGERWFCTESEAVEAGWRKALNC